MGHIYTKLTRAQSLRHSAIERDSSIEETGCGEEWVNVVDATTRRKQGTRLRVRLIARFDFSDQSPHSRALLDSVCFGGQWCILYIYMKTDSNSVCKCVLSDAFVFSLDTCVFVVVCLHRHIALLLWSCVFGQFNEDIARYIGDRSPAQTHVYICHFALKGTPASIYALCILKC